MLAWVGRSAFFRPPLRCVPRRCPVDNALRCPPYGTWKLRCWQSGQEGPAGCRPCRSDHCLDGLDDAAEVVAVEGCHADATGGDRVDAELDLQAFHLLEIGRAHV